MDTATLQQRSAELDYFLKLLPLSSLNLPHISWMVYETYPGSVVLRRRVSAYIDDEFTICPSLKGEWDEPWEITGARVVHERNTGEPQFRTTVPLPLLQNVWLISILNTLLAKACIACAPNLSVVARATMSFDPVEGEPDYVAPHSVESSSQLVGTECEEAAPCPHCQSSAGACCAAD